MRAQRHEKRFPAAIVMRRECTLGGASTRLVSVGRRLMRLASSASLKSQPRLATETDVIEVFGDDLNAESSRCLFPKGYTTKLGRLNFCFKNWPLAISACASLADTLATISRILPSSNVNCSPIS